MKSPEALTQPFTKAGSGWSRLKDVKVAGYILLWRLLGEKD